MFYVFFCEYRYVQILISVDRARALLRSIARCARGPAQENVWKVCDFSQCTQKERTTFISQLSMRCLASEEKVAELWGQS